VRKRKREREREREGKGKERRLCLKKEKKGEEKRKKGSARARSTFLDSEANQKGHRLFFFPDDYGSNRLLTVRARRGRKEESRHWGRGESLLIGRSPFFFNLSFFKKEKKKKKQRRPVPLRARQQTASSSSPFPSPASPSLSPLFNSPKDLHRLPCHLRRLRPPGRD
jgi:hypothetical protein